MQQHHQMRQQERQMQMQMTGKPLLKADNKLYRVQNPMRSELSLSVFFLLKGHIARCVKKTAAKYPKANIIFGKVGGSWWKPEIRIIIGAKAKNDVVAAGEMLQNLLNGGKKDKSKDKAKDGEKK